MSYARKFNDWMMLIKDTDQYGFTLTCEYSPTASRYRLKVAFKDSVEESILPVQYDPVCGIDALDKQAIFDEAEMMAKKIEDRFGLKI
jgi:hypothetical protein